MRRQTRKDITSAFLAALACAMPFASCEVEDEGHVKPTEVNETTDISVTDITTYSAVISGSFAEPGDTASSVGVRYLMQNTKFLPINGTVAEASLQPDGTYRVELDNLYSDTTYYFCTYTYDGTSQKTSQTFSFRTHKLTATTDSVSDVYAYGAQFNMTLSEPTPRGKYIGDFGVFYSTNSRPTREYAVRCDSTLRVRNLTPGKTYYYNAYVMMHTANLQDVYSYGKVYSFTTPEVGVTTCDATDVGIFEATLTGDANVEFSMVKEAGFIISPTVKRPTLEDVDGKKCHRRTATTYDKSGKGVFTFHQEDLEEKTTYYYRAFIRIDETKGGKTTENLYYGDIRTFTTGSIVLSTDDEVDLGLSVKWSGKNFGASAINDYGTYVSANSLASQHIAEGWRLPTQEEAQELVDSCHWTWHTYKHVDGAAVTGKNGNSIFLPASSAALSYTLGIYMTSTPHRISGIQTFRFSKDIAHENQCSKTAENLCDSATLISLRLVR